MKKPEPRVALVHDFLLDVRGAERVFLALCDLYPDADVFTAVYDPAGTEGRFAHRRIHTSFLQRLHPDATRFGACCRCTPMRWRRWTSPATTSCCSSSSAWAHGVLPSENAVHVCYCHNPFRYAWNARRRRCARAGPVMRAALGLVLQRWRQWDWIAAQRVDRYVANSETTRRRIARLLHPRRRGRASAGRGRAFSPGTSATTTSCSPSSCPTSASSWRCAAFNELRLPLVIIGDGPDARRLRRLAGPTVRFTGRVSDAEVARLLATSRALVVTATEEFGIAAVEAQAAGRPVVALAEGGVTESVQEGRTGVFYEQATPEALAAAVAAFDPLSVDPADCVANAQPLRPGGVRAGDPGERRPGAGGGPE